MISISWGEPLPFRQRTDDVAFRSSGMLARFVHCFAESDVGHRRYDTAAIPKEVKEKYHSLIHQFLNGKKDYDSKEVILKLSHHASEEYISYCNNYIEQDIKQSMCCCQDWGGKFHGLILRIACILHCVDCCSRGIEPSEERQAQEHIHNQREQEVQQSTARKKNSWGLE